MDDIGAELGEIIFALIIGYVGALELIFVLRHLCHLSGRHALTNDDNDDDGESLPSLKEKLKRLLEEAKEKERQAGTNVMKDGIPYKDGFRIDPNQAEIDRLKEMITSKEAKAKRRAEIEAELAQQRRIEEETRKKLEAAEAELARQREKAKREEEEEAERAKRKEQQQREKEQQLEEAENYRRLLEAEKQREAEQRRLEEEEASKQKEAAEERRRKEEEEANLKKLLEAEKQREEEQRRLEQNRAKDERYKREIEEEMESERKMVTAERQMEDAQRQQEESSASLVAKFIEAERSDDSLKQQQQQQQQWNSAEKQKIIEENARKFLEAEEKMVQQLQQKQLEGKMPITEEPIIVVRAHQHVDAAAPHASEQLLQTVKTQFGQGSNESFTLSSKSILFPSISDDGSSNEPDSSKKSSFSTQPSDEMTTGNEEPSKTSIGLQIQQQERQEPDGEDTTSNIQYTEEYLRSLDGLKGRSLTREDGSGRRRAFKKRRSSGSSNSSRDSRTSRDEELKMFTSLEEEEMLNTRKSGDDQFTPIRYTNDPNLKVKAHHPRRHKRSPAKDAKTPEDNLHTTLEMLGEEGTNPWGEIVPEHYKNTEFWQREKAMSIDEEEIELESSIKSGADENENADNKPKSSSFEEATIEQHQEAISALQKQRSKDHEESPEAAAVDRPTYKNKDTNLQSSHETEGNTAHSASASPRLRRSPRIEEIDHYEERWKDLDEPNKLRSNQNEISQLKNTPSTPTIEVHSSEDLASWRDEHGLLMQGLSDFYDFTASTNLSRSRSTSRATTPLPDDSRFEFNDGQRRSDNHSSGSVRTGNIMNVENKNDPDFIQNLHDDHTAVITDESRINSFQSNFQDEKYFEENNEEHSKKEINQLVQSLRKDRQNSRSRSISPLPTVENLEKSLETRRSKLIRQNDEILKSLLGNSNESSDELESENILSDKNRCFVPKISLEHNDNNESDDGDDDDDEEGRNISNRDMNQLVESLRRDRQNSRSRSRSPLPTAENLERSLEVRRSKLIRQNNEIFDSFLGKSNESMSVNDSVNNNCEPENRFPSTKQSVVSKTVKDHNENTDSDDEWQQSSKRDMNQLVESLRRDRQRSRSRSRSPLPTAENLEKSLEARRSKLIKKNDEISESLSNVMHHNNDESNVMRHFPKQDDDLIGSTRSSRSKSPLPARDNAKHSLELRENKKPMQYNDGFFRPSDEGSNDFSSPRHRSHGEEINIPIICVDSDEMEMGTSGRENADSEVNELVKSLRRDQQRSRSRSRSPLPTPGNIEKSLESRRSKLVRQNDKLFENLLENSSEEPSLPPYTKRDIRRSRSWSPLPFIGVKEQSPELRQHMHIEDNACSPNYPGILVDNAAEENHDRDSSSSENISTLVASLRVARSRTRSKSPMRIPNAENLNESISLRREKLIERNDQFQQDLLEKSVLRSKSPQIVLQYVYEMENASENFDERNARSRTPSRSSSPVEIDFNEIADLESSKYTEEKESTWLKKCPEDEQNDTLSDLPKKELSSQATFDDYDRTISEELRDNQRIKKDMLSSGFKRSKYVGESMDLGSEYENLRREAANFRRSRSPTPSIEEQRSEAVESSVNQVKQTAAERRKIQDEILKELILCSSSKQMDDNQHGAKPKTDRKLSDDAGGLNLQSSEENSEMYEDMRREMAEFRRSRSCSRSPVNDSRNNDILAIEMEVGKRELQDEVLDRLSSDALSFQNFSRHLNADFLDDRRASDSALIPKLDNSMKSREKNYDLDMEPEEYHHYRRFSLNQEQQIEEYPDDDDFICISQIEVCSLSDNNYSWIEQRAYYGGDGNEFEDGAEFVHEDEEDTENSDDERQTVVEVDDEIDTDICDFNERGPTDESHHEQSECEEADRAIDPYANHGANDWQSVSDLSDILIANDIAAAIDEEGAVGGSDSDSCEIDQIYDEAIKNRKQSGILREYDSILLDMQESFESKSENANKMESNESDEKERYALWSKTRSLERGGGSSGGRRKLSVTFLEAEKNDTEMRYLGDATMIARQSTRLRSRYGYGKKLNVNSDTVEDVTEVDITYKPKREYNWRKNFRLDDDGDRDRDRDGNEENANKQKGQRNSISFEDDGQGEGDADDDSLNENKESFDEDYHGLDDYRKISLGGESITLFSRSADGNSFEIMDEIEINKEFQSAEIKDDNNGRDKEKAIVADKVEKPKSKKKKSKKKSHRESKESLGNRYNDEDDSDSQIYAQQQQQQYINNGGSSNRQYNTESPPKRKSRSRRGSRSSIDSNNTFSPRGSIDPNENLLASEVNNDIPAKKKIKKRKKAKEAFSSSQNIKEEQENMQTHEEIAIVEEQFRNRENENFDEKTELDYESQPPTSDSALNKVNITATSKTSASSSRPATSISTSKSPSSTSTSASTPASTPASTSTPTSPSIDTFDILKDANFYPLF